MAKYCASRAAPSSAAPLLTVVFHALSHPTRRAMMDRLSDGPASVSQLADPHGIALPTLLQHLAVLEEAGLARSTKRGRVRTVHGVAAPLATAEGWLADQRRIWSARLDQLDVYLDDLKRQETG